MSFIQIIFYVFAGLTLGSALFVLITKNVLYAAFSLIVTFMGVAAIYVFAGADFIAVAQILIYAGGILVLMIFGVMFTHRIAGQAITTEIHNKFWGFFLGTSIFALLLYAIIAVNFSAIGWIQSAEETSSVITTSTVNLLGVRLMSDYILPFEIIALLLLIALIGAVYIAKKPLNN